MGARSQLGMFKPSTGRLSWRPFYFKPKLQPPYVAHNLNATRAKDTRGECSRLINRSARPEANFRFWHRREVPTPSSNVRVYGHSGKHILVLSSSHFDPIRTYRNRKST